MKKFFSKIIHSRWILIFLITVVLTGSYFVARIFLLSNEEKPQIEPSPAQTESDVVIVPSPSTSISPQNTNAKSPCEGNEWKDFCIIGSANFQNKTEQALDLMAQLSPSRYEITKQYAYRIREKDLSNYKLDSTSFLRGMTYCHGEIYLDFSVISSGTYFPTEVAATSWVIAHEAEHSLPGLCSNNAHTTMRQLYDDEYEGILDIHYGNVKIDNFKPHFKKGDSYKFTGRLNDCEIDSFQFPNGEQAAVVNVKTDGSFSAQITFNRIGSQTLRFPAYDSTKYWESNSYNLCNLNLKVWVE